MRGKLPWWLVVILGWIVIFAVAVTCQAGGARLMLLAKDTPGLLGGAWYMAVLAGAVVAVALVVALVRALVALASSRRRESLLAILTPPFLWLLYNVLARLPALLHR